MEEEEQTTAPLKGDEILAKLRYTLDHLGVTRTNHQIDMHEEYIKECLPEIYHESQKYAIRQLLKRGTIISTMRTMGKTWSVAMFCAASLWCIPNFIINIVHPGEAPWAKPRIYDLIIRFLKCIPGFNSELLLLNKIDESIVIKFNKNDCRKISKFDQYLKSTTCDLMFIDEAAYLVPDFFFDHICSLLAVKNPALIMITTPAGPLNYVNQLMDLTEEDGSSFFNVKKTQVICDNCLQLPTQLAQLGCTHINMANPVWKKDPIADV